jgi:multidrug efflux pump subunit AcrA (membrane-fusion protein)
MLTKNGFTKIAWLLLIGLIISGCSGLSPQASPTVVPAVDEEITPLVSATGVVTPADWTILSLSASGIVEAVLVEEGEAVEVGQVLVRLKGKEEIQAAITAAQFEVAAAEKALTDLNDAAEIAMVNSIAATSIYAKDVRDAQYQLDNFTVPANQEDLSPLEAMDMTKKTLDEARQAFEPYKSKPSNDPTREELKEDLDNAQSDYNAAVRRLEYENTLTVAQENLEKAREDYEIWSAGPDPEELAVAQARVDNANAALTAAQARLDDLELLAPFAGIVSEIDVRDGQWVTIGQTVLQLADLGHLRVETTDLNEIDAARVKVGSRVKVTFDALPDVLVQGTVTSLAPKASQGSGVNYKAVIELDEVVEELRWGMTAFVDIEVE